MVSRGNVNGTMPRIRHAVRMSRKAASAKILLLGEEGEAAAVMKATTDEELSS